MTELEIDSEDDNNMVVKLLTENAELRGKIEETRNQRVELIDKYFELSVKYSDLADKYVDLADRIANPPLKIRG